MQSGGTPASAGGASVGGGAGGATPAAGALPQQGTEAWNQFAAYWAAYGYDVNDDRCELGLCLKRCCMMVGADGVQSRSGIRVRMEVNSSLQLRGGVGWGMGDGRGEEWWVICSSITIAIVWGGLYLCIDVYGHPGSTMFSNTGCM